MKPNPPPPSKFTQSDRHQNSNDSRRVAFLENFHHASRKQDGKSLVHVLGRPEFCNENGSNEQPSGKTHAKNSVSTDRHDYDHGRQPSSHMQQSFSRDIHNSISGKGHPSSGDIVDEEVETKAFDIVYDPSRAAKDITIRLAMPIEEDLGLDLGEFCRLRRLGQFKDARNLYRTRLERHSTTPYIVLYYAEMLMASGD
ncbi:hypothetical protein QBC32DRAFT_140111 [Pseudoneurospora amorphoporcata]|uniref:Uncharacterized protein n=1 Tax=Pseudoneurospora amorphoporcata TaxID=241081 RepID=A0AAN6SFP3_9PEZI|nr:hypothetical protein QBC32DRAFT_140111 [Pseudoneurospora amorphoporcata]